MKYWLLKSEPGTYSIDRLKAEKATIWDGIRNYLARNNLRLMEIGDLCLFYHSNVGKEIVGLARVIKTAYQDPTTEDANWVVVEIQFEEIFPKTLTLAEIKNDTDLQKMEFNRSGRLSVSPVTPLEFDRIIRLTHP